MTKQATQNTYQDAFEYHGNTMIEHTRRQAGKTMWRKWIIFDSVEEAEAFFNDFCDALAI